MRSVRRLHLYLSVFFAPLLIFFISTGWYQTLNPNREKTLGERHDLVSKLRSVHVEQVYPNETATGEYSTTLFKIVVVLMSISLLATIALGIYLAFRVTKQMWTVCFCLLLGILLPVLCLWLGRAR
jgi:uncharacterized iron-regulated membrane protein